VIILGLTVKVLSKSK